MGYSQNCKPNRYSTEYLIKYDFMGVGGLCWFFIYTQKNQFWEGKVKVPVGLIYRNLLNKCMHIAYLEFLSRLRNAFLIPFITRYHIM